MFASHTVGGHVRPSSEGKREKVTYTHLWGLKRYFYIFWAFFGTCVCVTTGLCVSVYLKSASVQVLLIKLSFLHALTGMCVCQFP